jgi:hypothetical protein
VREIALERDGLHGLINLNVNKADVAEVLTEAGFTGYRYEGALKWIMNSLQIIKSEMLK